jgi:hypothetical protein
MNDDETGLSYEINPELAVLLARANEILARIEPWLPSAPPRIDWREQLWPAAGDAGRCAAGCNPLSA